MLPNHLIHFVNLLFHQILLLVLLVIIPFFICFFFICFPSFLLILLPNSIIYY